MSSVQASVVRTDQIADGLVRLAISGDVDAATVGELTDAITRAIECQKATTLIIDLAKVTFLGCAGANAILAGHALASQRRTEYSVVNASAGASRLLIIASSVASAAG